MRDRDTVYTATLTAQQASKGSKSVDGRAPMDVPHKLLIAEDEAILRCTLERILDPQYTVVAAVADRAAAVEAVQEHEPDIVLLDISMPVLNGLEAAQTITEIKPKVKVIMVTSHAEPAYVEEAFPVRGKRLRVERAHCRT